MTNDKMRATGYYLSGAFLYLLGAVNVWHAVKNGGDIANAVNGLGTLVFGSAPAYAGYKLSGQIQNGVPLKPVDPVKQIDTALQAINAGVDTAVAARDAATNVVSTALGLGTDIVGRVEQAIANATKQ